MREHDSRAIQLALLLCEADGPLMAMMGGLQGRQLGCV